MAKNIDNNKNIQGESIEKKDSNWFKEKWESIKNFLQGRKNAEEGDIREESVKQEEDLKDSAIDSTLDNLNLDMQEALELKDSDEETKKELERFFEKGKEELKDDIDTPEEKELSEKLLQNDRFKSRSPETVQQIAKSATKIETEIKNWQTEKNPVAKPLLKIVNRIMGTEK